MKREYIFPLILIALDIGAAVMCGVGGAYINCAKFIT